MLGKDGKRREAKGCQGEEQVRWKMRTSVFAWACTVSLLSAGVAGAYEKAFEKTPVGESRVLELPAAKVLVTEMDGGYFSNSNKLFSRLFRYIRKNKVAMTVPVEAEMKPGRMKFYVGSGDAKRTLKASDRVEVLDVPARTVAAIGARGGYSRGNFEEARDTLKTWIEGNPELTATGDAYAVYWNSPFVPWFLKRFDVHIPVTQGKSP